MFVSKMSSIIQRHAVNAARALGASMLLISALLLTGCGESGKEQAMKRDAATGEQHRARLVTGQTDR